MNLIQKSIIRKYKDKKDALFFASDKTFNLALLAFFIILGLEIYYQNRYLNDAIYLCGLGSGIYGALLLMAIRYRNQAKRKFESIYSNHNNNITESISFTEDFLEIQVNKSYSNKYYWDTLMRFNETKKHIIVYLGNLEFFVTKKYFSNSEIKEIKDLLQTKTNPQSKKY